MDGFPVNRTRLPKHLFFYDFFEHETSGRIIQTVAEQQIESPALMQFHLAILAQPPPSYR